jgi:hypothetical protein
MNRQSGGKSVCISKKSIPNEKAFERNEGFFDIRSIKIGIKNQCGKDFLLVGFLICGRLKSIIQNRREINFPLWTNIG